MSTLILNFLLKLLSSEATKTLIGIGINKLLDHTKDGITSDIATVMIDGIAKSKMNPTKEEMFNDALNAISKEIKGK